MRLNMLSCFNPNDILNISFSDNQFFFRWKTKLLLLMMWIVYKTTTRQVGFFDSMEKIL